jgi:hypothetical protein
MAAVSQFPSDRVNPLAAWAVRSGDVGAGAVPEPPSELLFEQAADLQKKALDVRGALREGRCRT